LINVVVGVGQVGSRHLQAILKHSVNQKIYVVDTNEESIEVAKKRAAEINHSHEIIYLSTYDDLPKTIDLLIISTNSKYRDVITIDLLNRCKIRYIIFEKILFQSLESYQKVENKLKENGVKAWVNHPRRIMGLYKNLKKTISGKDLNGTIFSMMGGNWGLACNSLHFIDLCSYLFDADVKYISTEVLEKKVIKSKRDGYIEFSGTLVIIFENNIKCILTSNHEINQSSIIDITIQNYKWIINELEKPYIININNKTGEILNTDYYSVEYQSDLGTKVLDEIIKTSTCSLTPFEISTRHHKMFIKSLLDFKNHILNENFKELNIT